MICLADENFPQSCIDLTRGSGIIVRWARTDFQQWKDAALVEMAETESFIILTLDKDLRQIAEQRRVPIEQSGVVLFRVHPAIPSTIEPLVRRFLASGRKWAGHISIITTDSIATIPARRI